MPVVTGANVTEWKMKEMARRAGVKYEPETKNPFAGMTKEQLKEQKGLIKQAKKAEKEK
ncbi:hypothetical protein UFOVP192_49 [uncultured Caudovirales phage]|uniref:Uncharacterized protein n=1 Tax=uncultured Caudovirales phage TaxID=2100421 RepID=A0A6J7WIS9_9CAUD|nr:hypothetical protein UFOVP192_49 [uncultured Caudovirales phage]